MAAAFAGRGHAFLSDDCLELRVNADGRAELLPHDSSIRLWDDSLSELAPKNVDIETVPGSTKKKVHAATGLRHCDRPTPLVRVYVLGEADTDVFALAPLSAAQAVMAWTANAFVLDIKSPAILRRNIDAATRLSKAAPVFRLEYPRDYRALDAVIDGILADVFPPPIR